MKKIILIIFFIALYSNAFSQTKENELVLNEKIKITSINLRIYNSLIYVVSVDKNGERHFVETPTSVTLDRINDKESYYYFHYNYLECDTIYIPLKNRVKFKTKLFDKLVEKMNKVNIPEIKESKGVTFDGSTYYLSFSNSNYEISIYADNPNIDTKTRNLVEFLEICETISKLTNYYY
ncbi:hypothetical protein OX283_004040 [Flavobacterium sp. SUN052]|uniref:hypothetical protein n=1 Tax=Flavobacterium sp. SUN052 TaxID=3002441 RepID=UPI00237EB859|nr:hypothetical protein [Flavobacterium sp. SUN052]MEC4003815.1 hypothetical protein [Flavobacterium sp. SUN052]